MSAGDARLFTSRALRHAGVSGVRVQPDVAAVDYRPGSVKVPVPVWRTTAVVEEIGTLHLEIPRRSNRAVLVDDVVDSGDAYILSPAQFASLKQFRFDPVADRVRRAGVLAGSALALAAAFLAFSALAIRAAKPERPARSRRRR